MKHTHFEKLIKKTGRTVGLPPTEREKMRSMLREYIAFKPIRPQESTFPWYTRLFEGLSTLTLRPAVAAIALLLIVAVTSGSVAVASEDALPGDTLYPVKVGVVEPTRTALTRSPEAKLLWQRTLAVRRLDEATKLVGEGRLSTTTEASLAANFEYHANATSPATSTDSKLRPTPNAADEDFVAQLSEHEDALTKVDHSEDQKATKNLRNAIRAQISKTKSDPEKKANASEDRPNNTNSKKSN